MTTPEQIPSCPIGHAKHAAAAKDGRGTGHPLCEKHYERLDKILREIEDQLGDLALNPARPSAWGAMPSIAMQWNTSGGSNKGGAPAHEQAPARLAALVLTDTRLGKGISEDNVERHAGGRVEPVLVVLSEYADRVRKDRGLTHPSIKVVDCASRWALGGPHHGPFYGLPCRHPYCSGITEERTVKLPVTVHTERDLLTRQLDWVVRWPDINTVFSRLRRLLSNLKRANGTAPQPVGQCPADKDPGVRCGGPLWSVKPKYTSGEQVWTGSTPSAVRCEACATRWEGPGELARLALLLETQRKAKAS